MTIICTEKQARDLIANISPGQLLEVRRTESDSAGAPTPARAQPEPTAAHAPAPAPRASAIPALIDLIRDFDRQDREDRKRRLMRNFALFSPFIVIPMVAIVCMIYPLANSGVLRIGFLR